MVSQFIKSIYFGTFAKLSIFSLWWHKLFSCNKYRNTWLHLGSGQKYIEGMVNIDGNIFRKKDIWLDLTLGLPFSDNSIEGIYTSHTLEHFKIKQLGRLLTECYRVLKPGGCLRIVVPSLEYAIEAWNNKAIDKLSEWPHKFNSIGGRFNNFTLCDNQHFLMFDFSFLQELLSEAGFVNIVRSPAHKSKKFSLAHMEYEYNNDDSLDSSLYVECSKPR
ncbi:methyltransferase domain-containing protein [Patescibacteria group bacterium]|nr:methyltransferase domain-containing protein [Patescibacteria group bacterium]